MRILLQQKKTGLFFGELGEWVQSRSKALDFASSSKAEQFCKTNKLADVQLVFKFEDQPYEIVCQLNSAEAPVSQPFASL